MSQNMIEMSFCESYPDGCLIVSFAGMISLTKKKPVVEFRTVEIDEEELKYRTHHETVPKCPSSIIRHDDEEVSCG